MFNNAFPDAILAVSLAKECVAITAENLKPGTATVQRQLEMDDDYLVKLAQPVSLYNLNFAVLTLCNSHVLRSQFSAVRSRSVVALLVQQT